MNQRPDDARKKVATIFKKVTGRVVDMSNLWKEGTCMKE